jgi:hypothetical protein
MAGAARAALALRPLDELRRVTLRFVAARPLGRTLARRRSVRVPLLVAAHALAAFALALLAPSFLIAVAPLVLGVPHLASDLRHLLLRRASPRWWLGACAGFAAMLIAIRALAEASPAFAPSLPVEQGVAAAWVLLGALGGAVVGASGRPGRARAWGAVAGAVAVAVFAVGAPRAFRMALLHGHNLIAVVIWLALFRPRGRLVWLPVGIVLAGAGLLASGALLTFTIRHGALSFGGLHIFAAADWLAPGLPDDAALALAISFAFLQSVHYAIWLAGIPAADRPGDGSRSLRAAARELVRDFSPAGLAIVAALALLVAGVGIVQPAATRRLFLSLGTFHGWLELAVLAYLGARGPLRSVATES